MKTKGSSGVVALSEPDYRVSIGRHKPGLGELTPGYVAVIGLDITQWGLKVSLQMHYSGGPAQKMPAASIIFHTVGWVFKSGNVFSNTDNANKND